MRKRGHQKGYILIQVLIFAVIAALLIGAVATWANVNVRVARTIVAREQAFQIAEAGIEYYRWHLAHADTDFYDGRASSTSPGPYVHDYYDKDGNKLGQYALTIKPPSVGSTVLTIVSTGTVLTSSTSRALEVRLAKPSWAKFSVVANDNMNFGSGTEVYGPIHSNEGVRFDGLAHNVVTSALSTYDDEDHGGGVEFGVHTHVLPPPQSGVSNSALTQEMPPSTMSARGDVFYAGRQTTVPALDFNGFIVKLADLKSMAQSGGKYFPKSGAEGYHIVLKTDKTYSVYIVNSLRPVPLSCLSPSWSIASGGETLDNTYPIPANGIIFVEDNVWVDGQINGSRVTIAAGNVPEHNSRWANIIINNNLTYTNYNGSDVVGLIAQGDLSVGLYSPDYLRIDGALVAQHGRVGRYYYNSNCNTGWNRARLTLFGMIATNERYGFHYSTGSGYSYRDITYDSNLLYNPPPSFPLTTDQYQVISWREVK